MKIVINVALAQCILGYFGYFLLVLTLILALKQIFTKWKKINKQFSIKNRTYYFYNDQINLKDFDARLLKIDKKDYNEIDIYYIGYVTIKKIANCNNINKVNPLYLMIDEMTGHFEEKNEIKNLILYDVDENKEV